jgi:hypothetical protein
MLGMQPMPATRIGVALTEGKRTEKMLPVCNPLANNEILLPDFKWTYRFLKLYVYPAVINLAQALCRQFGDYVVPGQAPLRYLTATLRIALTQDPAHGGTVEVRSCEMGFAI